jgi:hypothetical protein
MEITSVTLGRWLGNSRPLVASNLRDPKSRNPAPQFERNRHCRSVQRYFRSTGKIPWADDFLNEIKLSHFGDGVPNIGFSDNKSNKLNEISRLKNVRKPISRFDIKTTGLLPSELPEKISYILK